MWEQSVGSKGLKVGSVGREASLPPSHPDLQSFTLLILWDEGFVLTDLKKVKLSVFDLVVCLIGCRAREQQPNTHP